MIGWLWSIVASRAGLYLLAAGLLVAGYQWHTRGLVRSGYNKAMAEVQQASADDAREQQREYTRLLETVKGKQDEYIKQAALLERYRSQWRDAADRVRQQDRDFAQRIAAASADGLRRYAQAADGDFERCIGHVERFAAEATANAAAAHALSNGRPTPQTQNAAH